jgi:protein gp37
VTPEAEAVRHTTGIQWTWVPGYVGATWNPTTGCTRVSPGCDNCYAFTLHDQRYKANLDAARAVIAAGQHADLSGESAIRTPEGQIAAVRRREAASLPLPPQYDRPFSTVQLLDDKRLTAPLRARKPHAYFVDSMADLFHEDVPDEFLDRVFAVMALSPQHIFMVLTKRPERMRSYLTTGRANPVGMTALSLVFDALARDPQSRLGHGLVLTGDIAHLKVWPLPNVWLGFSAEDQQRFDERWPHVRDTPAAVRFVSMEPLLDGIDARRALEAWECAECGYHSAERGVWSRPRRGCPICSEDKGDEGRIVDKRHLDWIIVGGESGPRARPFDLAWARDIVAQCRAARVAPFVKQLGAVPTIFSDVNGAGTREPGPLLSLRNRHGSDLSEWPEDLRVREFPALV